MSLQQLNKNVFLELEIKKHFNKPKTSYEPTINHTYYFRTRVSGNNDKVSDKYEKLVNYYNRDYVKFYKDHNGKRKQLVEYEIHEKYW